MGLMNCGVQDICLLLEENRSRFLFSFFFCSHVGLSGRQRPTVNGDAPKVIVYMCSCPCMCLQVRGSGNK